MQLTKFLLALPLIASHLSLIQPLSSAAMLAPGPIVNWYHDVTITQRTPNGDGSITYSGIDFAGNPWTGSTSNPDWRAALDAEWKNPGSKKTYVNLAPGGTIAGVRQTT